MVERLPDDPIISCIERTGYPPWWDYECYDEWEEDGDSDVYYGNETADF